MRKITKSESKNEEYTKWQKENFREMAAGWVNEYFKYEQK